MFDLVADEPLLLARGYVWETVQGCEVVGADRATACIVPYGEVAIETKIPWPLESAIRSCIGLYEPQVSLLVPSKGFQLGLPAGKSLYTLAL